MKTQKQIRLTSIQSDIIDKMLDGYNLYWRPVGRGYRYRHAYLAKPNSKPSEYIEVRAVTVDSLYDKKALELLHTDGYYHIYTLKS
jgi:hypothetical protein